MAAVSCEGLIAYQTLTGTTDGDILIDFLLGTLIPRMRSFPAAKSMIIMDNCSIHHMQKIKGAL